MYPLKHKVIFLQKRKKGHKKFAGIRNAQSTSKCGPLVPAKVSNGVKMTSNKTQNGNFTFASRAWRESHAATLSDAVLTSLTCFFPPSTFRAPLVLPHVISHLYPPTSSLHYSDFSELSYRYAVYFVSKNEIKQIPNNHSINKKYIWNL